MAYSMTPRSSNGRRLAKRKLLQSYYFLCAVPSSYTRVIRKDILQINKNKFRKLGIQKIAILLPLLLLLDYNYTTTTTFTKLQYINRYNILIDGIVTKVYIVFSS